MERILETSGLTRGRDYVTQGQNLGLRSDTGSLQRPDAIVYLPEGKHIVIDSKVTLVAYEKHVEAEDAEQRKALHAEFVTAVKRHVDELSSKRYQEADKLIAHDFVLMFVPIEGALALAMQDNDGLFEYAWSRRIAIVGPTSLLMTLKVVATIWRYQRQGENATKIAERAALIYDKLEGVVSSFNRAREALDTAKSAFEEGMGRLALGRGNVLSQAQQFTKMGVKPKKTLPKVKVGTDRLDVLPEEMEEATESLEDVAAS